jgi:hypothetical protein
MMLRKAVLFLLLLSYSGICFEITAQVLNVRAPGYKGLWSSSMLADRSEFRFSGGMATYSAQHNPTSIFSAKAGKTFFVYGGTSSPSISHLQIMVSYFDHKTSMVPKPVIVLDKDGVNDPQDNATISMDSQGYIYVFVSGIGRTRPGYIFKSNLPYSIDSFEILKEGEIVFPQPWWVNDSIFIMFHTRFMKGRELFISNSTDGKNWSNAKKIVGFGGHNLVTESDGRSIVAAFNYFPGGGIDKQTNLYFMMSDDLGKTWRSGDGKVIQIPLNLIHNEALVRDFETEKKHVYIKDINIDATGNPVILILISNDYRPGPGGDPRDLIIVHRKENKWMFTKICELFHNYSMGSVFIKENEWTVIAPTSPGPKKYGTGGEMVKWVSTDQGNSWKMSAEITKNSEFNGTFARRPVNASKSFYSFWCDGDPEKRSESRLYFTDESCRNIWVLPYNMERDLERPKKLKKQKLF